MMQMSLFSGQVQPYSGGYSTRVPPLPIPNREVKPCHADGTASQWEISVLIDVLIPSLGNTVYLVTIIGTLFALVGAIVTTIPEYRTSKTMKKMEV